MRNQQRHQCNACAGVGRSQYNACARFPCVRTRTVFCMARLAHSTRNVYPPRWWYRYVDDSHACLKKDYVQGFHDHLNSVNPNIQFTKEVEKDNRLSFLETTTTRVRGRIQVSVYRKPTHTDRYLDYNSHPPNHSTRGQSLIYSFKGPKKFHQQMQGDLEKGDTPSKC